MIFSIAALAAAGASAEPGWEMLPTGTGGEAGPDPEALALYSGRPVRLRWVLPERKEGPPWRVTADLHRVLTATAVPVTEGIVLAERIEAGPSRVLGHELNLPAADRPEKYLFRLSVAEGKGEGNARVAARCFISVMPDEPDERLADVVLHASEPTLAAHQALWKALGLKATSATGEAGPPAGWSGVWLAPAAQAARPAEGLATGQRAVVLRGAGEGSLREAVILRKGAGWLIEAPSSLLHEALDNPEARARLIRFFAEPEF